MSEIEDFSRRTKKYSERQRKTDFPPSSHKLLKRSVHSSADVDQAARRNETQPGAFQNQEAVVQNAHYNKSSDSTARMDPGAIRFVSQAGSYPASSNSHKTFEGLRFSPLLSGNRMQVLVPNRRTVRDGREVNGQLQEAEHQQFDRWRRPLNSFQ